MSERLFIADSGLQYLNGHNASALQALASTCGPESIEFFCHHNPDPAVIAEALRLNVRLTPFFTDSFYDTYDSPGTLTDLNCFINSLAADYARLCDRVVRSYGGGLVLHHTMDWPHLLALGLANASRAQPEVRHLVFLMFDPGVGSDGAILNQWRALNYRVALRRLTRQGHVTLFASCHEHAAAYGALYPEYPAPSVHPVCFFGAHPATVPTVAADDGDALRRSFESERLLLYLGDAKVEKGFCRLPELIHALLPYLDSRSALVVQYNLNDGLSSAKLRHAARSLDAMSRHDTRLRIVPHFLSDGRLMTLIAESDVVLFDYDPGAYAHKTSGLLWQVCRCETPVVLLGESWLSREARRLHPWVRVHGSLQELLAELASHGAVAFKRNGPDKLYRAALFSHFGEFIKAQSVTPLAADHQPQHPMPVRRQTSPWRRQALVVDLSPPGSDKSGGGYAAIQESRMLTAMGFDVSFASPDGLPDKRQASAPHVDFCREPARHVLKERGADFDLVYVTRFHVAKPLISEVRRFAPQAKFVLNVADLHFLREIRKAALEADASRVSYAESIREQELAVLEQVDLVLCYTDVERAVIESHVGPRARVGRCPWVEERRTAAVGYDDRRDVAFLGSYSHAPNVDAVLWFAERVMPLLRAVLPGVRFRIYGADVPPALQRVASEDVRLEGFVEDVSSIYDSCRVFVAPLQYGAGLKAKVAAALAHGTPSVLSPVAAEGVFADHDQAATIAERPEEWVAAIHAYYSDAERWAAASCAARQHAARRFGFQKGVNQLADVFRSLDIRLGG